jgi:hypothetical protein
MIHETTHCTFLIDERELNGVHQVQLTICEETDQGSGIKCAIEMVENVLVRLLGSDESRGRLLYDLALSYSDDVRPEGVVFQRNPLNSLQRVWMCVVDLPCEVHEGELKYLVTPFLDGDTFDQMHQANCIMKICTENFGVKLIRCRPYALILGKQVKNMYSALLVTKNALKRYKQNKIGLACNPVPSSRWASSSVSNAVAATKQGALKPRIITIPEWLFEDISFREEIRGVYFC